MRYGQISGAFLPRLGPDWVRTTEEAWPQRYAAESSKLDREQTPGSRPWNLGN